MVFILYITVHNMEMLVTDSSIQNPEVDKLLDIGKTEVDTDKRLAAYKGSTGNNSS